jgi:hypothetical protein
MFPISCPTPIINVSIHICIYSSSMLHSVF